MPSCYRARCGASRSRGVHMLTILFDGIAYGMLLFVLASGLAVTLGLMNFINLAHGSFAMAGGYITVVLVNRLGVPFFASLPLAFLASAVIGFLFERTLYVHVYRKPHLDQVLFTIGLVFMSVAATDYVMGSSQVFVQIPEFLQGQFEVSWRRHRPLSAADHRHLRPADHRAAVHPRQHALRQPPARRGRRQPRGGRARASTSTGFSRSPSPSAPASPVSAARSAPKSSGSTRPSRSSS